MTLTVHIEDCLLFMSWKTLFFNSLFFQFPIVHSVCPTNVCIDYLLVVKCSWEYGDLP